MNRFYNFPNNDPGDITVLLYWDSEQKCWNIWFGDDAPLYSDENYSPFPYKLIQYIRMKEK